MSTGIEIDDKYIFAPLLVDRTLNIQFEVPGLNQTVNKLKWNGYAPLHQTFCDDRNHDKLEIDVLLGVDVIQYMVSGSYQKILGGTCFVFNGRVAPLGNVFNFLDDNERKSVMNSLVKTVNNRKEDKVKTIVNLVMDPLKSYFNPLENILEDSEVDNGLEYLFSLESMGIKKDDKELVSFDEEQIEKFKEGISFQEGYYNVELPWYPDKINLVPSNHFIALKVLDRTMNFLQKKRVLLKNIKKSLINSWLMG